MHFSKKNKHVKGKTHREASSLLAPPGSLFIYLFICGGEQACRGCSSAAARAACSWWLDLGLTMGTARRALFAFLHGVFLYAKMKN